MATGRMIRKLFYKEWLKTRYAVLAVLVLGAAAVTYVFLDVRSNAGQYGMFSYVNMVLYGVPQADYYRSAVKYLPLLAAVAVGLAQYLPEALDKRIKLTFHLPMENRTSILLMLVYGFGALVATYMLIFGCFFIVNNHYFPGEETLAVLVSVTPWLLGGVAAYFMIAMTAMEPRLLYRFLYALVGCFLVAQFYIGREHGDTLHVLWKLAVLAVMPCAGIFFTSQRFIKGER